MSKPLDSRRAEHRVQLDEATAARLRTYAFDLAEDEIPVWRTPLPEVIGGRAPWRDWLEAGVLAGYVPHCEGISLALRGLHELTRAEMYESERAGALGDAISCGYMADAYRELIGLLERLAIELECDVARLHRAACERDEPEPRHRYPDDAAAAEARAAYGQARIAILALDAAAPFRHCRSSS